MTRITRRAALAGMASLPAATVAPPAVAEQEAEWALLRRFLETASDAERMHYHLMKAADAVNAIRPGSWCVRFDLDQGFIILTNDAWETASAAPKKRETSHPDAKLIQLGNDLTRAWQAKIEAERQGVAIEDLQAAVRVCGKIARRIEAVPARTPDGLRVKAMAVNWSTGGEPLAESRDTTDIRLARSIVDDLLAMGRTT